MARRRSLWSEFQRERERQRRETERAHRAHTRAIREAEEADRQAQRVAERREATKKKEQEKRFHEDRAEVAAAATREVDARVEELRTLLVSSLDVRMHIPFSSLKREPRTDGFSPSRELSEPIRRPEWDDFAPAPPGPISGLLGGKARYEEARSAAWEQFQRSLIEAQAEEEARQRQLSQARQTHTRRVAELEAEVRQHNQNIDLLQADFYAGEPETVEEYFGQVLAQSVYPDGFPHRFELAYRPEPQELVVRYELPGTGVVPTERGFRYVKARQAIDALPRATKEIKELYGSVIAQVALRTLRECFDVEAHELVDTVVFNGHLPAKDKATGKPVNPCLVTVSATREKFDELVLADLEPAACLRHLNALVSPHPYDLEPVPPLVEFDLARYRFTDPLDAVAELDARSDLLKMDAIRFEHLTRQLFEAIGMKAWVTQASRDDGLDAVAINEDPIVGGLCVIQAKRYRNVVSANDVRALAAVVDDKRAAKGILVTTSWVGSAGREFAKRHGRIDVIEGPHLKHLLAEHLALDVRIDLPKRPARRR